jgi:hypothetical protein
MNIIAPRHHNQFINNIYLPMIAVIKSGTIELSSSWGYLRDVQTEIDLVNRFEFKHLCCYKVLHANERPLLAQLKMQHFPFNSSLMISLIQIYHI